MFTLKISTANEAFDDEGAEIARILRQIADYFAKHQSGKHGDLRDMASIYDSNGNTVGKWELK